MESSLNSGNDKIIVFIPMYNCKPQIGRVLAQFSNGVEDTFSQILVVDNRSTDGGAEEAIKAAKELGLKRFKIVRNNQNYSLGGSHKVAFNYALEHGHDYLVVLHGDDQGSISDLLPHISSGKHRTCDSLLGSRFAIGSKRQGYSLFRTLGNYGVNLLCSLALGAVVSDMGSGLNMYRMKSLAAKDYLRFPNDLTFNVFLLFHSIWARTRVKFFPLCWREDDQVSNAKVMKQGIKILKLIGAYLKDPQKVFTDSEGVSQINYSSEVLFDSQESLKSSQSANG